MTCPFGTPLASADSVCEGNSMTGKHDHDGIPVRNLKTLPCGPACEANHVHRQSESELTSQVSAARASGSAPMVWLPVSAVKELKQRLAAAEAACLMYGWTGNSQRTDRDLARDEVWHRWAGLVGSAFLLPEAHPELIAQEAELAECRRSTIRETLARIRSSEDER